MAGLRYDSVADMPEGMRRQVAAKLVAGSEKGTAVAGTKETVPGRLAKNLPKSKYGNVKTEVAGITFDSRKEARRYQQLMAAIALGVISDLRLQVDFTLREAYTTPEGKRETAIRYKADFTYKVVSAGYDKTAVLGWEDVEYWRSLAPGTLVVEDVKSKATRTKTYIMKKKLMADKGYIIREV